MTDDDGESALVAVVRDADALVAGVRERFDPAARLGVAPHVTLLYPFVPVARIDREVEGRIAAVLRTVAPFRFRLATVGRFPGVAYLAPEPAAPFVALVETLWRAFPEHPPFSGRHATIVPHLTVASGDEAHATRAARELAEALRLRGPVEAQARAVSLLTNDGGRWHERRSFDLGARASAA